MDPRLFTCRHLSRQYRYNTKREHQFVSPGDAHKNKVECHHFSRMRSQQRVICSKTNWCCRLLRENKVMKRQTEGKFERRPNCFLVGIMCLLCFSPSLCRGPFTSIIWHVQTQKTIFYIQLRA